MKHQFFKKTIFVLSMSFAATSFAQKAGDTIVGVGLAYISPNTGLSTTNTTINGATSSYFNGVLGGTTAHIKNELTPSVSVLYMFTDNIATELSIGVPPKLKVDLTIPHAGKYIQDANSAKAFTPAVVAKYLFNSPSDSLRPYLGLGATHASFKSVTANQGADTLVPTLAAQSVSMSSSWAPIYNAGIIYNINDKWSINGSISYIPLKSDVVFVGAASAGSPVTTATLKLNPTDYIIRVGYKF